MATIRTTLDKAYKFLIPGARTFIEDEARKQINKLAEPILEALAQEFASRMKVSIKQLYEEVCTRSGAPQIRVLLTVDYNDERVVGEIEAK